jgi:hypothetical protein
VYASDMKLITAVLGRVKQGSAMMECHGLQSTRSLGLHII